MEIDMKRDEEDSMMCHVTINNKLIVTTTHLIEDHLCYSKNHLKAWIRDIQKLYSKKNHKNLLVALSAQTSLNYANGTFTEGRGNTKELPYELLQLCVGNNCLLYEFALRKTIVHKTLQDFFCDKRTIVIGVGIHKLAAKLQKDYGFKFGKCVELRDFAGLEERRLKRADVAEVARVVSRGEMDYVKPRKISWQHSPWLLSDDLKKHATVEVFLVHHVGAEVLKDFHKF